ncbi:MAG: hypothetical protein JJU36_12260 [Phycisphaeraceae bacterium]|nr:hypothetical protein [Phycisphaeraceae bacterium]
MGTCFSRRVAHCLSIITLCLLWAGSSALAELPRPSGVRLPDGRGAESGQLELRDAGRTWVVRGGGRESYMQTDEGTFAGFATSDRHFRITARIASAEGGGPNPKYGLAIRSQRTGYGPAVLLRYDGWEGNRCLQWFTRFEDVRQNDRGGRRCFTDDVAREWDRSEDVWIRMTRHYPFVTMEASLDGSEWKALPVVSAILLEDLHVGVQVTAGGDGQTPVTVTFDNLAYETLEPPRVPGAPEGAAELTRKSLGVDWQPEPIRYRMYQVHIEAGAGTQNEPHTAFLVKPENLDWKDVRAAIVSAGSKELPIREFGEQVPYVNGPGGLRRPRTMADWQGKLDLPPLPAFFDMFAEHGLVRVGGVRPERDYKLVMQRLAELTGQPHIAHLPGMATGDSFGGGRSNEFARFQPDRAIAAAPVIIGIPGGDGNEQTRQVPMLHVWGSVDGGHYPQSTGRLKGLREMNAKWASTPMFHIGHVHYNADTIVFPFFLEMFKLRMPEDWDRSAPPKLRPLKDEEGWIGLLDGSARAVAPPDPQIMPISEYDGEARFPVWLANERMAHYWRHFVADERVVRIAFPTFNHSWAFVFPRGFARPEDVSRHQADKPFDLIATGPLGDDVQVKYFINARQVTPRWTHPQNPYHVRMPPLPRGLHTFTMEVRRGDRVHLSRPVTVSFH